MLSVWTNLKFCRFGELMRLKKFADNKFNVVPMIEFAIELVEIMLGKAENMYIYHSLKCFHTPLAVELKHGIIYKDL